jgi:hypothetical protein
MPDRLERPRGRLLVSPRLFTALVGRAACLSGIKRET